MTELLMPAGSPDVLRTAVRYGADAVYVGGEMFSLRANAKNFTPEEMAEGVKYCHDRGRKLYVTANITAHNRDLAGVRKYFTELNDIGPDAVIISDPGVFTIAKEVLRREIAIHISTQANNVNAETFRFWYNLGASRVVCGRELSLKEIAEIRAELATEQEIEAFVHGAMCISYSGRCLLSNYMTGRDANLGACTHPCRWSYHVVEESRPGEYWPVEETERGTFIFNSKDLCMIEHIPELIAVGVDSFKVEGRMKTAMYSAVVARTYRNAIDDCLSDIELYQANLPRYRKELDRCTNRDFTTGFFFGKPGEDSMSYSESKQYESVYYGEVSQITADGGIIFTQKNKFSVGDRLEFLKPDGKNLQAIVASMTDEEGNSVESCPHPGQKIIMRVSSDDTVTPEAGDIMRGSSDGK